MYKKPLQDILHFQESLLFYKVMKYPVPKNWQYFICEKKHQESIPPTKGEYSWETKNEYMDLFLEKINKHARLYKSLPFIRKIYLCNSITFNALKKDSDIDLFIITKRGALRRARFFSAFLFTILGLKRSLSKKGGKFCLSFYVDEDHQNLYNISLPQTDIYLVYRLAHLVPLYEENTSDSIYTHNKRIETLLPNFSKKHTISLGQEIYKGNSKVKIRLEKWLGGIQGSSLEFLIKTIRVPILILKTRKIKEAGRGIIINNTMLKFHLDQRKKFSLLYKTMKSKFSSNK